MFHYKCQNEYIYKNFDNSYQVEPCQVYFPENLNDIIN